MLYKFSYIVRLFLPDVLVAGTLSELQTSTVFGEIALLE